MSPQGYIKSQRWAYGALERVSAPTTLDGSARSCDLYADVTAAERKAVQFIAAQLAAFTAPVMS